MSRPSSQGTIGVVLFSLFAVVLLIALAAGLSAYGAETERMADQGRSRLAQGLLVNSVKAADGIGAIQQGEGPEGPALVLAESTAAGSFQTRFYRYQGMLCQEYAPAGAPYDPAGAVAMFPTGSFAFQLKDGLLTMETDEGTACVALHSPQGGEVGHG